MENDGLVKIQRALISVSDKTDIVKLARKLADLGIEIISTGGTYKKINDDGTPVMKISAFTGTREVMDGRVKTLHPAVHGGILYRRNVAQDADDLTEICGQPIDLVIVNLYPFQQTVAKTGATDTEIIEEIDIGGPTAIRGAAKNHESVTVVVSPDDYPELISQLEANDCATTLEFRRECAKKVFATTCNYDLAIGRWLSHGNFDGFTGTKSDDLKYGENPQQKEGAASYTFSTDDPLAFDEFEIVDGQPNGFINNTDLRRELACATRISTAIRANFPGEQNCYICLGVKHNNACGAGISFESPQQALRRMIEGNPTAISGGFILTNFELDIELAKILKSYLVQPGGMKRIFDGIIAPSVTEEATAKLRRKDGRHRIMINPALNDLTMDTGRQFSPLRGGFQIQPPNPFILNLVDKHPELIITGDLSTQQCIDASLAKALCDESTSNTITYVRDGKLLGNGTCRPSRVSAAKTGENEANMNDLDLEDCVVASDSFFPVKDGPQTVIDAGAAVVVTTSGSRADEVVFKLFADEGVTVIAIPNSIGRGFNGHI